MCNKATREADPDVNPAVVEINNPKNATFKITVKKLYVPGVTLSAENDNKLLDKLKTGFERTIKWNKNTDQKCLIRLEITFYNLNYLIDPTFTDVNRLFVLQIENEKDRTSFSKSYVPKVKVKKFNVLIDGKPFFEIPVKNKDEAYEAIIEMSKSNNYTTGHLLDYEYFSKHYRLIAIDLIKQIELKNLDLKQQITFIDRLEENNAAMFFIIEKKNKKLPSISHKIRDCFLICIKVET